MGSNLLRQDDLYTFEVINRTLESIVPTLVKVIITPSSIQYCVYMYFSIQYCVLPNFVAQWLLWQSKNLLFLSLPFSNARVFFSFIHQNPLLKQKDGWYINPGLRLLRRALCCTGPWPKLKEYLLMPSLIFLIILDSLSSLTSFRLRGHPTHSTSPLD